ncbi:MAG: glutathione S-transferase [Cohaesibacter sp.]|jgi:glutathione S-transferase|nr:glutathione S-transferase [Cohaesibacter sp.]
MTQQSMLPILYSFRRCPYAMRGRMGIYASGMQVILREIVLRAKPAHMLEHSPKGTVPVLLVPQEKEEEAAPRVIDESLDIMLWALEQRDPQGWLMPQEGSLKESLALIAHMDGDFKRHLDRYKYATRYEECDELIERSMALLALAPLADRLKHTPHLFGVLPSLADIALFPFVRQFANTDRVWFDQAAPSMVRNWLVHHESSDLFAAIFKKWPVWSDGDAITLFPDQLLASG